MKIGIVARRLERVEAEQVAIVIEQWAAARTQFKPGTGTYDVAAIVRIQRLDLTAACFGPAIGVPDRPFLS